MKKPETMSALRDVCAQIMVGALDRSIAEAEARVALNAATRIIESVQAETRARALAHTIGVQIAEHMPIVDAIFVEKGGK